MQRKRKSARDAERRGHGAPRPVPTSGIPPRHRLGRSGEAIAAEFLRRKGLQILARNWRDGPREIDLIARDGTAVVIVEVKTRAGPASGRPEEAVGRVKQHRLARAAAAWLARHEGVGGLELRYDVLAVWPEPGGWRVLHQRDAFFPGS